MLHEDMLITEICRITMLQVFGFLTATLIINQISAFDPEAYMNATQMIQHWGYPVEIHEIITGDGFILRMFRIPHGRNSETKSPCNRPAVLFSHGLGGDSTEFYMNPPESSPAFLLADAGFDVFLINHRGGTYSKRHVSLKPWQNKFWQWTIDEMAKYDCPAAIDKVLELSGKEKTYWIGHSMGTTLGYGTIATNPEYNNKITAMFMLAPSGTAGYTKGPLRAVFWLYNTLKPAVDFYRMAFGAHETAFPLPFVYRNLINLCNIIPFGPEVARSYLPFGLPVHYRPFGTATELHPRSSLSLARTERVFNVESAAVGSDYGYVIPLVEVITQCQMARSRRMEHFDHSPVENMRRYGKATPPPYDYSVINVPVFHFWSRNDILQNREDIDNTIMNTLRKEVVKDIEVPEYNHFDYAIAVDCAEKVFNPITRIVRSQESGMCER
ncbi:hypothetical protein PRIPAC_84431 [Pristionchus pacificus]|uniref:Hydrolase n=1 Tax=Pristionchus pacificus TaxID=54126 RepID=A0A2A6BK61_PRIPA|nr:hypothetical protein PRIPAC_84431 [Pristionchus pacificus]|eukprot:PDM66300.1 hydrolase [Pristionchus pacificus]